MATKKSPRRYANDLTVLLNQTLGRDRFPVNVKEVAKEYSSQVYPNDPITIVKGDSLPGFDGALCRAPDGKKEWGIFYNSNISSTGRINFTLAHEFGHYLLHRQQFPDGLQCNQEDMVRWDSAYRTLEQEANQFAATFLMPVDDFRVQINSHAKPCLGELSACAERYSVSLTATVLRWLEYTRRRAILVVSRDGFILWSRSSNPAFKSGRYLRTTDTTIAIPENTLHSNLKNLNANNQKLVHDANVWIPEPCEEVSLISDRYDFVISLLHLDDTVESYDMEEEAEEDTFDRIVSYSFG